MNYLMISLKQYMLPFVFRYEDKTDPTTNVVVLRSPASKFRIGSNPDLWIKEQAYLLSGSNETIQFQSGDEGRKAGRKFSSGKVSSAKILNVDTPKYKQGLTYYNYEILTKQGILSLALQGKYLCLPGMPQNFVRVLRLAYHDKQVKLKLRVTMK